MTPFVVILALLAHELGHYVAARLSGLRVERVVIGFGKIIYRRTDKNGTDWCVHLWPFRAYVGIEDFNAVKENIFRRLFVVLAGPLGSLILPFIMMFFFFAVIGKPVAPNIVTAVDLERPAYGAGLRPGDKIVSVDGTKTDYAAGISAITREVTDRTLSFGVERGGELLDLSIRPDMVSYRDVRGVKQKHGLIGIYMLQLPLNYESIEAVDGIEITGADDEEKVDIARLLIHERLGKNIILRMKSADRAAHDYLVTLPVEANADMMDEDSDTYCCVYLGAQKYNYYYGMSLKAAVAEALSRTGELIRNVAKLPFNLFPIEKKWIQETIAVTGQDSVVMTALMYLYHFVFLVSLFSVLIGMINLIPIPGLDGSVILIDVIEAVKRRDITRKEQALWMCGALILFYAAVVAANAGEMEGYYSFLIDKFANGDE